MCQTLATLVEYDDAENTHYLNGITAETAATEATFEAENDVEDNQQHGMNLFDFRIPTEYYHIISQAHNSKVGHMGVEATLKRIRGEQPYPGAKETNPKIWKYQREHVRKYIRCCPACQMMSQLKIPIHTRGYTLASLEPMYRLAMDSIGPLPPDIYGNTAIIVIIDTFTRYVFLYAAPDMSARSAMRALLLHNQIFGQPHQIVSDNGTQYCNEIIAELTSIWGVEHLRTVAHSHEENGMVERANKEVMRHLRALIFDTRNKESWSDNIPIVQRIINTTVHENIGCTPHQLLFGNAINITPEVYLPISALNITDRQLSKWASDRLQAQYDIIETARELQQARDRQHVKERQEQMQSASLTVFPPGTWVKVAYPRSMAGQRCPDKLEHDWRGPYKVTRKLRGEYEVLETSTNDLLTFSEHLIQPYLVEEHH